MFRWILELGASVVASGEGGGCSSHRYIILQRCLLTLTKEEKATKCAPADMWTVDDSVGMTFIPIWYSTG
jgi:hypothetical protein